jgi:CBS domain containing-hemolysin-like protein
MKETHEDWSRQETVKASSDRTFGLVFTAFFALVAFLPLVRDHRPRWWAAVLSGLFLVLALAVPGILRPLNRAWTALGGLLHTVTNPILLGILFYLVFTPFGWLLRRTGKDFLRLKRPEDAQTYWIVRQPPGPEPQSMSNQF